MKATVKDGKLTIVLNLNDEPSPSSTGKMLLYAYCPWSDLGVQHDGVPIRATVTVGTKNPDYVK